MHKCSKPTHRKWRRLMTNRRLLIPMATLKKSYRKFQRISSIVIHFFFLAKKRRRLFSKWKIPLIHGKKPNCTIKCEWIMMFPRIIYFFFPHNSITLPVRKLSCWGRFTRFLSLYWKSMVVCITPIALLPIILLHDIPVSDDLTSRPLLLWTCSYRFVVSSLFNVVVAEYVATNDVILLIDPSLRLDSHVHSIDFFFYPYKRTAFVSTGTSMHVRRIIDDRLLV